MFKEKMAFLRATGRQDWNLVASVLVMSMLVFLELVVDKLLFFDLVIIRLGVYHLQVMKFAEGAKVSF